MNRRYAILTALLLASVPAAGAMGQAIRLRPDVRISGDEVRLGDVARVTGLPTAARQVIVLTLTDAEGAGQVDLGQVESALRRAGINPVPIRFSGAARCTVRRGSPRLTAPPPSPVVAQPVATPERPTPPAVDDGQPAGTIGERIGRQLAAQLGIDQKAVTVKFSLASLATVSMTAGADASIISTDRRPLGRRRWRVECTIEGHPQRRYVSATVSVRRKVVTAARPLAAGETIGPADVQLAEYDDDGSIDVMTDPELAMGQQVKRIIQAGAAVSSANLISPVLVKRGQNVWVQCGPVRLAVRAMASGRKGDSVALENVQSKRRFWAVVTGPGQAEVAVSPSPSPREVTK